MTEKGKKMLEINLPYFMDYIYQFDNFFSIESSWGKVYSIQHYVIKIVSATGQCFSLATQASSNNKTDCNDITEILLKVTLNTINLKLQWRKRLF